MNAVSLGRASQTRREENRKHFPQHEQVCLEAAAGLVCAEARTWQKENGLLSSRLSDRTSLSQVFRLYQSGASERLSLQGKALSHDMSVNEAESLTAQECESCPGKQKGLWNCSSQKWSPRRLDAVLQGPGYKENVPREGSSSGNREPSGNIKKWPWLESLRHALACAGSLQGSWRSEEEEGRNCLFPCRLVWEEVVRWMEGAAF